MDVRGWGGSTRPAAMAAAPEAALPAVLAADAVADIAAVVATIRARHGGVCVALVGWATGGYWVGMYAAAHGEAVARLATLNALYGVAAPWTLQAALEDRPRHLASPSSISIALSAAATRWWPRLSSFSPRQRRHTSETAAASAAAR